MEVPVRAGGAARSEFMVLFATPAGGRAPPHHYRPARTELPPPRLSHVSLTA
jgi:hypothetical protein